MAGDRPSVSAAVALVAVILASLAPSTAGQGSWQDFAWPGLENINAAMDTAWNREHGELEVQIDVVNFLAGYDRVEAYALDRIDNYTLAPYQDLKPPMELALAVADVHELPGVPTTVQSQLLERLRRPVSYTHLTLPTILLV